MELFSRLLKTKFSVLLFLFSFLIPVCSEECDCYDLKSNRRARHQIFIAFEDCIESLPEIARLNGYYFDTGVSYGERLDTIGSYFENFENSNSFSVGGISSLFSTLSSDFDKEINDILTEVQIDLNRLTTGKRYCNWENEAGEKQCIPYSHRKIARLGQSRLKGQKIISETQDKFLNCLEKTCLKCKEEHENPRAHYEVGCLNFTKGRYQESLDEIAVLIAKANKKKQPLSAEVYFYKGASESELGLYHDAILSLEQALLKKPQDESIYFERAAAYFERGQFDKSITDYLASGAKQETMEGVSISVDFASGLAKGIKKGIQEEFDQMLPAWAPIMSVGLWALANNPSPSAKFVTGALACVAAAGVYFTADEMVTELRELVTNWGQLSESERGVLTGYVIGKYGIEVFACYGIAKGMESYSKLKKANSAMTFNVMLTDEATASAIRARYKSIEKLKNDQEFIQKSFLKKPYPEHEIRETVRKLGYILPERPKGIPSNFVTEYSNKGCGITYRDPAKPAYNYIRLMPGNPQSPNLAQQKPYIVHVKNGNHLDSIGNKISGKDPQAHIPVEKFVYTP